MKHCLVFDILHQQPLFNVYEYSIKPQNAQEEINETMDKKNDVLFYFIRLLIYREAPFLVITMQRFVFFVVFFFPKCPVPSELKYPCTTSFVFFLKSSLPNQ